MDENGSTDARVQDLEEIEEWNEYGELKENIGPVPPAAGASVASPLPAKLVASGGMSKIATPKPGVDASKFRSLPGASEIKTGITPASAAKAVKDENAKPAALSKPDESVEEVAKTVVNENVRAEATSSKAAAEVVKGDGVKAASLSKPDDSPEGAKKSVEDDTTKPETTDSTPAEKEHSMNAAKALLGEQSSKYDHLSAPASAVHSGSATPAAVKEEGDGEAEDEDEDEAADEDVEEDEGEGEGDEVKEEGSSKPVSEKEEGSKAAKKSEDSMKAVSSAEKTEKLEASWEATNDSTMKAVEGLQLGDGKNISKQVAADPDAAGKSVED